MPVVGVVNGPISGPSVGVGRDGGDDHRLGNFIADHEGGGAIDFPQLGVSQVGKVVCRSAALDGVPIRQNLGGIAPESYRCGCAADPHNAAVADLKVSPFTYIKANTFRLVVGGGRRRRELRSAGHMNVFGGNAVTCYTQVGGRERQRSLARNGQRGRSVKISGHDAYETTTTTTDGDIVVTSIGKQNGQPLGTTKPNLSSIIIIPFCNIHAVQGQGGSAVHHLERGGAIAKDILGVSRGHLGGPQRQHITVCQPVSGGLIFRRQDGNGVGVQARKAVVRV